MKLGYYAYYPTLLEPAPGPWGGAEIFELHPVDAWRRIGQTLRDHRADGAIVMHNMDWGMSGMTHPCARLNLEAFYHYIHHPDAALAPASMTTPVWRKE